MTAENAKRNFILSDEAKKEIDLLKEIITQYPCLAHPDLDKQFYIHVDASAVGIGAILTQVDEKGRHRVIEYASHTIKHGNLNNTQREAFGVLWALEHFRYYVIGREPIVYCDCKCLSDVFKSNNLPGTASLRNWVARLLHYNPKVLHQPGKAMAIPDALSRAHTVEYRPDDDDPAQRLLGSIFDSAYTHKENEEESLKTQKEIYEQSQVSLEQDVFGDTGEIRLLILPTLVKTSPSSGGVDNDRVSNFLAQAQRDDPYWIEIIDYIQYGLVPRTRARAAFVRSTAHSYMIDEKGILRKLFVAKKEGMDKTPPAILPSALLKETFDQLHDQVHSGHRKYEKLLDTMRERYWFPNMPSIIKRYCEACPVCQQTTIRKKGTAPLRPYYASYPGITVHIDCTPGPNKKNKTERGNTHIMAIVESFTRHVRLFPIGNPSAEETARCLLSYISIHSMPLKIIVDNGSEFANELMTELSLLLGLKKVYVTPYNSKANGKVEVVHKTTQTILRGFMEKFNKDWDILLPLVEFAMNTSVNKATGFTPFFLHFGRHPIMPLDAYHDSIGRPNITVKDYVKDLQEQRMQVFNYVNEKLAAISAARKKDYDAKNAKNFKYLLLGDTVRIRNGDRKGSYGKKFNPIYKRDYWTVINDLGGGTYEIQNMVDPTKTKTLDI